MGSPVLNAGRERRKGTFHQHLIAMARYIAALALLGAVLADGTGHSAPAASYGAPSYEEPSYAAPAASYGAPSYDTPSYDAPATGYAAPSAAGYESYAAPSSLPCSPPSSSPSSSPLSLESFSTPRSVSSVESSTPSARPRSTLSTWSSSPLATRFVTLTAHAPLSGTAVLLIL